MGYSDQGDQPVPSPAASDHAEDSAEHPSELAVKVRDDGADNADSAPDAERLKKINDLKQAVADGSYHVSAEEVARKIIEHMREPKG